MDPDLEPLYDGIRLTPAGLESAAVEVIRAGGDHPNSKVLDEVRRQNVLIRWRALPGMADASDLQQRWIDADSELEKVLGSLGSHGYTPTPHDWALARAWVLACTVNPEHQHRQLSDLVTGLDPTTADRQSWWHALRYAENPGPCQLVATLLDPSERRVADAPTRGGGQATAPTGEARQTGARTPSRARTTSAHRQGESATARTVPQQNRTKAGPIDSGACGVDPDCTSGRVLDHAAGWPALGGDWPRKFPTCSACVCLGTGHRPPSLDDLGGTQVATFSNQTRTAIAT